MAAGFTNRLTPTQIAHQRAIYDNYFSPQAVANRADPVLAGIQELSMIEDLLRGWKSLGIRYGNKDVVVTNSDGLVVREGKNELPGFALIAPQDDVALSKQELIQAQINEVQNALNMPESAQGGFTGLNPDQREYVQSIIAKHIAGGSIDSVGEAGTKNRVYPKGHELEGQVIPVKWEEGQKRERGTKLMLDKASMVDPKYGVGLHGVEIDAMHDLPAAQHPHLVNAVDNIYYGPRSMNQGDGKAEGAELDSRRRSRLVNLQDQRFFEENGVSNTWRGGLDPVTRRENLEATRAERELDEIIAAVRAL